MDESALIALGILVEETAREILGETGDLVFTEAADDEEDVGEEKKTATGKSIRSSRTAEARNKDDALDSRLSSSLSPSSSDDTE
jgi:hypothetical protein